MRTVLRFVLVASLLGSFSLFLASAQPNTTALGLFETHAHVGITPRPGSATYDAATREYRITGGGANMWGSVDAFHFVWKKLSGDFVLTADVRFLGVGAVNHRKA